MPQKFNPYPLETDKKEYIHLGKYFKHIYFIKKDDTVYYNLDYEE